MGKKERNNWISEKNIAYTQQNQKTITYEIIKPTTKETMEYIETIKNYKQYIKIGMDKYSIDVAKDIKEINDILELDIIMASFNEIAEKIDNMEFLDYMDIVDRISSVGERIYAIVSEEINPMLPYFKKTSKKEDAGIEK